MIRRRIRWLVWPAAFVAALVLFSFAGAAILVEGALHPLLRRRASDTAILAHSIAESTGATARKVSIRGDDGTALNGWWLTPERQNGRAIMVCHGVADSAYGALGFAPLFLRHGYAVLVPESRGHGESLGFVTYGVLEADDTVRWVLWIKTNQVNDVFGFGESLGGAILIQSLPHGADFRAIVAESSYSSFEAVADERVARFASSPLAFVVVREGLFYAYIRYGVNLSNARPDLAIAHAHIPILLIQGLADNETSPAQSIRLAKINPQVTKLWLVPGAKHTGAYATAPTAFEEKVLQWFQPASQSGNVGTSSSSMRPESPHSSQPLRGPNLPLVHSKVMRNFVPECLFHQALQILAVASDALVGALEYRDSVRKTEGLEYAAISQRTTFIQPEKSGSRGHAFHLQPARRRFVLDYDRYVIHAASEPRGDVA